MQHKIKYLFDFLAALALIVLLLPLMLLVSLISFFILGSPILFVQDRVGFKEKVFKIYKFRTMAMNEHLDEKLRLSKWGTFLRKSSLDELPQLLNVLKGELSLVGPRPLLIEYIPLYSSEQKLRHTVRPGITGWAQVNGRNSISWQEKFNLDIWYVRNFSILLDIKILFLTVARIINPQGVDSDKNLSMPKFNGKN
jgi:sugar transferase EpsL